MKLFSPSEFVSKALNAFKRFPFTLVWVLLFTGTLVVLIEQDPDAIFKEWNNLFLIGVLGVSWLIGGHFYIEQFKKKGLWWINALIVLLLIAFYFTLPVYNPDGNSPDITPYLRWAIFIIVGHFTLLFAPFITVWHPKAYWNYLGNMLIAIARSVLFSGVFYLGLVLAMLAVQYLFDININGKRYFQMFVICLGVVNTWVYLSDFPKNIQHNIHLYFTKAIEVFVKFILIPLAILYTIILYAYALKICVQWELPKGWVSYLVIALATLLFLIQFIIHPVRTTHESRVFRKFQPLAYWLLLPLLLLFYVAIYKRISDYGMTEARYFLIVIAVFITGATLYLIASRKQQLRYLPIALALFGLIGSFGFWGAFSMSTRSQVKEFKKVYSAFAKAEKGTAPDEATYERFSSITKYLAEKEAFTEISEVIGYNPKTTFVNSGSWNYPSKILDSLGLNTTTAAAEIAARSYSDRSDQAYDIKGYQWSKNVYFSGNSSKHFLEQGYSIQLDAPRQLFLIEKEGETVLEIPTKPFIKQLQQEDGSAYDHKREHMQLAGSNEHVEVKIYFQSVGLRKENNALVINYGNGLVLLNIKK